MLIRRHPHSRHEEVQGQENEEGIQTPSQRILAPKRTLKPTQFYHIAQLRHTYRRSEPLPLYSETRPTVTSGTRADSWACHLAQILGKTRHHHLTSRETREQNGSQQGLARTFHRIAHDNAQVLKDGKDGLQRIRRLLCRERGRDCVHLPYLLQCLGRIVHTLSCTRRVWTWNHRRLDAYLHCIENKIKWAILGATNGRSGSDSQPLHLT